MPSRFLVVLALAQAATTTSIPKSWTSRERSAAEGIQKHVIAAHVKYLADDLLEGRAPASKGGELAMKYIAAEYERLGLAPAGDEGTYFQKFGIVALKSELSATPIFKSSGGGAPLVLRTPADTVVSSGLQQDRVTVSDAEVVFVGYGIVAPEQRWDDFKDLDVRGKILMVMNNDPADDPALFAGRTRLYYGRWTYKYEEAARKGAAGVIIIHTTPSAGYPWQVVTASWGGEQFELPQVANTPRIRVKMWATEDASRKIAQMGGHDLDELRRRAERRDFKPVPLGVRMSLDLRTRVRRLETANVLGILKGGDARLAQQAVVYSAHHDHLGIGEAKGGDKIYNGALDNASGVAAMLAIAEGMVSARPLPKRSILFAAVAAEESGLLGSEYFCAHPPIPAGRIAANVNIDGINIHGRARDATYIGLGKSSLDGIVKALAQSQGRVIRPDQFPDRGHFYRSDQFNFARIGVPAVYLESGTDFVGRDPQWGREKIEEYERLHYHQPSDEWSPSWNLDGALDDLRMLLAAGLRVADGPAMPTWKPGDEFEAARKKAISEANADGQGVGGH
jgi:Zn-dependent M28 family amino/carboxypeptidase